MVESDCREQAEVGRSGEERASEDIVVYMVYIVV